MLRPVLKVVCLLLVSGLLPTNYVKLVADGAALAQPPGPTANCRNPNDKWGSCVPVFDCPSLLYVLRKSLTAHYRFVRLSQCDAASTGKYPNVCCTGDSHFNDALDDYRARIVFPTRRSLRPAGKRRHFEFPQPPHCGSITVSSKVYGGEEAELTEFSWMTQLEYRTGSGGAKHLERVKPLASYGKLVSECAGSIINERYVLTAAHCTKGPIEDTVGRLVSVRVGEHNALIEADCNQFGCLAPYQRVGIESITIHENYKADADLRIYEHHDIALIRMDRSVEFTDNLQPVCLPALDTPSQLKHDAYLVVAGWGHNGTASHSATKQKVKLPFVEREECRQIYSLHFHVADEQLCAGGVHKHDSCTGDSGGPLMRLQGGAWVLEGIVSFGRGCGLENRPGIYTEVRKYVDWIDRNMKEW